jgi:Uma2 family endonuclease
MHADPAVRREELIRRWTELGSDPSSPDYYELNEFGETIMSPPPSNRHQEIGQLIAESLVAQLGPKARVEMSVYTDRGIRVPDVVWMNPERWNQSGFQTPLPFVPYICVEVMSPGNTREEIQMKASAYLRGGAREVIVIGLEGEIQFFGAEGAHERSALGLLLNLPANLF